MKEKRKASGAQSILVFFFFQLYFKIKIFEPTKEQIQHEHSK